MRSKFLELVLFLLLAAAVVSGFAHTWEQTNTTNDYLAISMSADGRIICAVTSGDRVGISTNYGKTWFTAPLGLGIGGLAPNGAAISADGSKIYAVVLAQSSWLSTNQGLTWTQTSFPAAASWRLACSADGTKVIASSWNGPLCYSTNSGANCYTSSIPSAKWVSLASSAEGSRMVTAVNGGDIYFSTNYGALWTPVGFSPAVWTSACVSGNGRWIGATTTTNLYISSDAGVNWFTNNFGAQSIACSADGSNWIVAGPLTYTSTDGGVNWTTNLPSVSPGAIAISADGCEMCVLAGEGIWMGHATPSPQLNIQSKDSNLSFSWLLSSTNFALQQNADLGTSNWSVVSNAPILNFSNLQQEVTLPAPTNSMFFRLIAQ